MGLESRQFTRGVLIIVLGLFVIAFYPVWRHLVGVWYASDEYSHGFLIVPVALFLVWRRRTELGCLEPSSTPWGLVLAMASLAAYLVSILAGVMTTAGLSMIAFLAGAILFLFGRQVFRVTLFPLVFLLFMIPVPAQIYASMTAPLQLLVSRGSVWLASLAAVPVIQEGNLIILPQQTLQVVDACSGLRSMMALLVLSSLVWHLSLKSRFLGTILLVSAVPIALLINLLRVTAIVVFLWHLNVDLTGGILHTILGLTVNFLALLMIFTLRGVCAKWDQASPGG